jgi:hypothetical protein
MNCGNCGASNDAKFKFCDSCGAELLTAKSEKVTRAKEPASKNAKVSPLASTEDANKLELRTWAGLRWLFATNYGTLTITETHLKHEIKRLWASNIYSIIVKIFCWGFDIISSLILGRGATALKSISTIRIMAIDWIVWKGHFIFIWSGGLPDIYIFSSDQLPAAEGFVSALKKASASFKYTVSK